MSVADLIAKLTIPVGVVIVSLPLLTQAQITLDDSVTFTTSPNNEMVKPAGSVYTISAVDLGSFDATGSDKLVLTFSGENLGSVESITYGGVALSNVIVQAGSRVVGIYYLDNPGTNGNLVLDFTGGNGVGGSLLAISGAEAGIQGPSVNAAASSTTISPPLIGTFVVAAGCNNGGACTAQSPLTPLFDQPTGSSAGGSGYLFSATPDVSVAFSTAESVVAVGFEPIPGPSGTFLNQR